MRDSELSRLPLKGVKVVDFGQYMAGPVVAMILADLGATVVHTDPPDGPLWDTAANATLNRNKLIVNIDLTSAFTNCGHSIVGKITTHSGHSLPDKNRFTERNRYSRFHHIRNINHPWISHQNLPLLCHDGT